MTTAATGRIRILLADDHPVVRRGLKLLLETQRDLEVVSEADDGAEAVRRAIRAEIDIAILDLSMPRMSGLQATRELARLCPHVKVIVLSMHNDPQYLVEAVRAGASGYVLKSEGSQRLIRACRDAYSGQPFTHPPSGQRQLQHAIERETFARENRITTRESQVLSLIADGHSTKEIASVLVISPRTVERHRENLLRKLHLRNRVELTRYALRSHLTRP